MPSQCRSPVFVGGWYTKDISQSANFFTRVDVLHQAGASSAEANIGPADLEGFADLASGLRMYDLHDRCCTSPCTKRREQRSVSLSNFNATLIDQMPRLNT